MNYLGSCMPSKFLYSRALVAAASIAILTACGGGEQVSPSTAAGSDTKVTQPLPVAAIAGNQSDASANSFSLPVLPAKATSPAVEKSDRAGRPVPVVVSLGAPLSQRSQSLTQSAATRKPGTALQLGFGREVVKAKSFGETAQMLQWVPTSTGGSITSLGFQSGEARGLRIGVLVKAISPKATVRFYAPNGATVLAVSGEQILATIRRNTDAGDLTDAGRTYWGPYIAGDTGILEVELPLGVPANTTEIAIPNISHYVIGPLDETSLLGAQAIGDAAACHRDISCVQPPPVASKAVALMSYLVGANAFSCTGTLLNDRLSSGTPYFLSAHHCISTQTSASSLQTVWFAKSTACNSGVVNPAYVILAGGATLLWSSPAISGFNGTGPVGTDTSFMRLNDAPPLGALYAGWIATPQAPSPQVLRTGIHHPRGDLQKISDGLIDAYSYLDSNTAYSSPTALTWPMYRLTWSTGLMEGGSSGSGLFADGRSSDPRLVGQLWGGNSSCAASTSLYGRFDVAYKNGLREWLDGTLIFRFYNTTTNTHFYTIRPEEKDAVIAKYPQFSYEGPVFSASRATAVGLSPVFRFYNIQTGAHFFTISQAERDSVIAKYPQFQPEGAAWYASTTEQSGWVPLYRFYNVQTGTHFFTASAYEKDQVIIKYPTLFSFEGIAYYIRPLS